MLEIEDKSTNTFHMLEHRCLQILLLISLSSLEKLPTAAGLRRNDLAIVSCLSQKMRRFPDVHQFLDVSEFSNVQKFRIVTQQSEVRSRP